MDELLVKWPKVGGNEMEDLEQPNPPEEPPLKSLLAEGLCVIPKSSFELFRNEKTERSHGLWFR